MVSHKEMVRRAEEGVKEAFNEAVKRGNAPKDAGKADVAWFNVNERMGYGSLCVRTDEDRVFCTAFTQSLYEEFPEAYDEQYGFDTDVPLIDLESGANLEDWDWKEEE